MSRLYVIELTDDEKGLFDGIRWDLNQMMRDDYDNCSANLERVGQLTGVVVETKRNSGDS